MPRDGVEGEWDAEEGRWIPYLPERHRMGGGEREPRCGLDARLLEAITELVRAGAKPRRAALALGTPRTTWDTWQRYAKEGREPWCERIEEIDRAEAMYLAEVEIGIGRQAKTDWRAGVEVLRRRLRHEYGDRIEITPPKTASDLDALADSDLEAIALAAPPRG